MKLTPADLHGLADLAITAATAAGRMIAASQPSGAMHKDAGDSAASQVVTEIDLQSEEIIVGHLEPTLSRFDLALLTEERADDGGRLERDHFWCIDPLDGTLPFIEGTPGYAVSIALVARDGTPLVGVIHDPSNDVLVHAVRGSGAFREHEPWSADSSRTTGELTAFMDRSFLGASDREATLNALDRVAADLDLAGVRVETGSGAVKNALGVLANRPACYLKRPKASGGGSLWDFAATTCVFGEVGASATDFHGDPLDLNRVDSTFMHHRGVLFASDHDLAQRIRRAFSGGTSGG